MAALDAVRTMADRDSLWTACHRTRSRIKGEVATNSRVTSNEIFTRVDENNVPKSTHCRILKTVARRLKPVKKHPLQEIHQENLRGQRHT